MKEKRQLIQDKEYELFPYHYLLEIRHKTINLVKRHDYGFDHYFLIKMVNKLIKRVKPKSVLDVGCGDGKLIYEICRDQKLLNEVEEIIGIDKNSRAIQFAKIFNMYNKTQFFEESVFDYECKDFDMVILLEMIEHIHPDELVRLLKKISSFLGENKYLIISVPSKNLPLQEKHFQHFDLNSLKKFLNGNFTIQNVFYIGSTGLFVKILNHIYMLLDYFKIEFLKLPVFSYYKKRFFLTSKNKCRHIMVICTKN